MRLLNVNVCNVPLCQKSAAALKRENRSERSPNKAAPCLGGDVGGPCNVRNVSGGIVPRRPVQPVSHL